MNDSLFSAHRTRHASPAAGDAAAVRVWAEDIVIPTYLPQAPDRNPMFLEKRVYQGSSGRVYPLPFTDRIAEHKQDRVWKAIWLENEYLKVLILPEIGGRIHAIYDKTSGSDVIYRQDVIKPALVGLAGPWISGGIEFNWPQHHRPATFLPVDTQIEEHADGSTTVWCSDHDPMSRMKGMHGVCLYPGKAYMEVKARAYNRTPFVQTFLWWANVATRVHEGYQSFFPPDVSQVADHAKRAVSTYPLCQGTYYGVDYGKRARQGVPPAECPGQFVPPACLSGEARAAFAEQSPLYPANDLSWYANIPVPTSYMCTGTREDFFGGYDHFRRVGIVHVANHHISPGKKQWTWGNHDFGYAWDRNLTDPDETGEYAPYIELMAGVYTDNQPDFSFLQPGETKVWSQFWYPIHQIGTAQHANRMAAVRLDRDADTVSVGVCVSSAFPGATVRLEYPDGAAREWSADLAPGRPFRVKDNCPSGEGAIGEVTLSLRDRDGARILTYTSTSAPPMATTASASATEPPGPASLASIDELYLTGLHLEQYRHATRSPVDYWNEALSRDPLDARCNNAIGLWRLRRGEYADAERHFRAAIRRLTHRNPNPYDGEPFYNLGLCLRFQLDALPAGESGKAARLFDEAYASFYKATWNQAWAGASYHALAEMDSRQSDWETALAHLEQSLRFGTDNLRARDLKAISLRRLGRISEADAFLRETISLDPLDWWARYLAGERPACDAQASLDIAHDLARAGLYAEAIELLGAAAQPQPTLSDPNVLPTQAWGAEPLLQYTLGWLHEKQGAVARARDAYSRGFAAPPDYCFPARLEEIAVLDAAIRACPSDSRAPYYLGCLLYDRRRHEEGIALWERSASLDPTYSVVWRCLGIGYFNITRDAAKARDAYDRACAAAPYDIRLLFEQDQLRKRLGDTPEERLRALVEQGDRALLRDDLSVELCALYNQTEQPEKARAILLSRRFQPWEGGEGQALGQWMRTHLALGKRSLSEGDYAAACDRFAAALAPPMNLSEDKHLLLNPSNIRYWLGVAFAASGDSDAATRQWLASATFKGDFQEMSVRQFSEMTYYSALSWRRLGNEEEARHLLEGLLRYACTLEKAPAEIDYFATSLPTMLLFEEDLSQRQETTALFLQAQAKAGLGDRAEAMRLLAGVLERDPGHALAADLKWELAQEA